MKRYLSKSAIAISPLKHPSHHPCTPGAHDSILWWRRRHIPTLLLPRISSLLLSEIPTLLLRLRRRAPITPLLLLLRLLSIPILLRLLGRIRWLRRLTIRWLLRPISLLLKILSLWRWIALLLAVSLGWPLWRTGPTVVLLLGGLLTVVLGLIVALVGLEGGLFLVVGHLRGGIAGVLLVLFVVGGVDGAEEHFQGLLEN